MNGDRPKPTQIEGSVGNLNAGLVEVAGDQVGTKIVNINPQSEPIKIAPPYFYPGTGSSNFVGRSKDLLKLDKLLQSSGQVAIAAATGMGESAKASWHCNTFIDTEIAIQEEFGGWGRKRV